MSADRSIEPVAPDLDVVVRKCCPGRSLKLVTEHGLEPRGGVTVQTGEKAQRREPRLASRVRLP